MNGRMRPYLPELTIRDYNTYLWYLRGVRQQLALSYGKYSCRRLRYNSANSTPLYRRRRQEYFP